MSLKHGKECRTECFSNDIQELKFSTKCGAQSCRMHMVVLKHMQHTDACKDIVQPLVNMIGMGNLVIKKLGLPHCVQHRHTESSAASMTISSCAIAIELADEPSW